ncbi:MAG: hypothetical protein Q8P24_21180 [Desulfobacterales bacterium]|nr:hypothetical protein [Desulfobacterales bacterium]
MNLLFDAAREFQLFFERENWPFCFIGGLAVLRWGEVRMTQDIDASLFVGYGEEQKYIDIFLKAFSSRIPDAREFALTNRVLLLSATNRVSVDVVLSGLDYEWNVIERSSLFEFAPECLLRTCSAEDLIVLKAFANRSIDWLDIEGILARSGDCVDGKYILKNITPLAEAKDEPQIAERVKRLMDEIK